MSKLRMKARSGVTLVELLVVILIVTILSVSLLPLLKPYIEQAKYAAEVQSVVANIQTKINLYQYEKDKLPCTDTTTGDDGKLTENEQDSIGYTWSLDTSTTADGAVRIYQKAMVDGLTSDDDPKISGEKDGIDVNKHLSAFIDVDWQDLTGRRINPSHFVYHVIRGLGSSSYGYVLGVFGDGEGLSKGTGYAVLVLVDTNDEAKIKLIATWERYKPVGNVQVRFKVSADVPDKKDNFCYVPTFSDLSGSEDAEKKGIEAYRSLLVLLRKAGWSFNSEDYAVGE